MVTSQLNTFNEANSLIWGNQSIKDEVFQRWCQGFNFSSFEVTALQQEEGGPCAVIAAVQAAIVRNILFTRRQNIAEVNGNECLDLLASALSETLSLVCDSNAPLLVYLDEDGDGQDADLTAGGSLAPDTTNPGPAKRLRYSQEDFFARLRVLEVENAEDLSGCVLSLCQVWQSDYGVLCFLYAVVLSHSVTALRNAMADEAEALIDLVHGHASQCLLNLLITGRATPYLFDGERDLGGYSMTGIIKQPQTGFLTIVEAMRYCEVGWYLKNPGKPVWILGSETHLTVIFSTEGGLIQRDTGLRRARKVFHSMDQTENGFIPADKLEELLQKLQIEVQPDEVRVYRERLDPEDLGIILEHSFLREFFPQEMDDESTPVKQFPFFHYNGLARSNPDGKVQYREGKATINDVIDLTSDEDASYMKDDSPIHRCLLTKWATITVDWASSRIPSLN